MRSMELQDDLNGNSSYKCKKKLSKMKIFEKLSPKFPHLNIEFHFMQKNFSL